MDQQQLKLIGRLDGPSIVPAAAVAQIATYRQAVIACWLNRRATRMTYATLCERTGMRPSHIPDYLDPSGVDSHGRERRDMPAKYIPAFELVVGNTFISQWFALQSNLPVLNSSQMVA